MLTIRLQRAGSKNRASFRIVLAQSYRSASKQALEVLGHYNPKSKEVGIKDTERLNYWIGQHVSISPTVYNLLVEKKFVTGTKVKAWQPKKKEKPAESEAKPAVVEAKAEEPVKTDEAPKTEEPKVEAPA